MEACKLPMEEPLEIELGMIASRSTSEAVICVIMLMLREGGRGYGFDRRDCDTASLK